MTSHDFLADRFQGHRPHLKTVAYRMLGSRIAALDILSGPDRLAQLDLTRLEP
ncbi:hypothetical protein [Nonomuraea sp. MG754425]|uniref:hypothetical protein n=1 Tax=Nonomuraea sp. MG754425 TaxID=2570319 RepID=UPI001F38C3D0|nr:hypothetical protein [Nonomuraea sp. MG754425]